MTPNRLGIIAAELWWGDKCSHAALAAVLSVSMGKAHRLMPDNKQPASWKSALDRAGRKWRDIGTGCPAPGKYGLVCLSFSDGTSHAVAIRNDVSRPMAFDNLSARWVRLEFWESIALPIYKLSTWSKRCWIHSVIEVDPSEAV